MNYYSRGNRSVPKIFDQFIYSRLPAPLINSSRDPSNFENVHNFLFIYHIGPLECLRIKYSILIGKLTGSCEFF